MNEKVLKKLPKKYHKYFARLEDAEGMYDDDKYTLYFAEGYAYMGEYPIMPVKSIAEAIEFLKEGDIEKAYYDLKNQGLI